MDLIDPLRKDNFGLTNVERMERGLGPIGPDGKTINVHHMLQTQDGPVAELTQEFHQKYSRIIHINPPSIRSGIDGNDFDKWRIAYWKNRSKDFK
jgi:hypothetical protein